MRSGLIVFLNAVRQSCGLALALAATASTAFAMDTPGVPEINPGSAVSALALLCGGVLLLRARFRGK